MENFSINQQLFNDNEITKANRIIHFDKKICDEDKLFKKYDNII